MHGRSRHVRNKLQTGQQSKTQLEVNTERILNIATTAAVSGIVSTVITKKLGDLNG